VDGGWGYDFDLARLCRYVWICAGSAVDHGSPIPFSARGMH